MSYYIFKYSFQFLFIYSSQGLLVQVKLKNEFDTGNIIQIIQFEAIVLFNRKLRTGVQLPCDSKGRVVKISSLITMGEGWSHIYHEYFFLFKKFQPFKKILETLHKVKTACSLICGRIVCDTSS